ncbi:4'-phosphopantetheinyl transferase [Microbulbifer sp. GL-2]|uniref:4'-phosphopantetheinyl transferase family protein n=1 Tax=Microbulbifer sp. GL-2 TaxID=2591606 RepID=UPI0011654428|nr:4'-phosphopantetheinyl transferase superfamily protein [Microbulbifer sp. GL-2]BBM02798.1 4'-phosphopantetheinyl transferase [Microbulbifer sp. GL-2]
MATDIPPSIGCDSKFISADQPIVIPGLPGIIREYQYFPEHYHDSLFCSLGIHFPEDIQKAVTKRKAEFLAGRYSAQQALRQIGCSNFQVPIGTQRSPQWPEGIKGAITHSGNRALCALSKNLELLGIDYELPIPSPTAIEIQRNIVTDSEAQRLSRLDKEMSHWLTIAFSIKESLFKALHPIVNQYFDFLDAEIIEVIPESQSISLSLTRTLCPEAKRGQVLHGSYHPHRDGFFTLVGYSPKN